MSAESSHMADDDGVIRKTIAALAPDHVADETPQGRLAGIDRDTWLTYREMYQLLTGELPAVSPAVYEQSLRDLADRLVDLHKRAEQAFEEIMEAMQ